MVKKAKPKAKKTKPKAKKTKPKAKKTKSKTDQDDLDIVFVDEDILLLNKYLKYYQYVFNQNLGNLDWVSYLNTFLCLNHFGIQR